MSGFDSIAIESTSIEKNQRISTNFLFKNGDHVASTYTIKVKSHANFQVCMIKFCPTQPSNIIM